MAIVIEMPEGAAVRQVCVVTNAPYKLYRNYKTAVEKAVSSGFSVTTYLGGPEQFPSHTYNNAEMGLFAGIAYFTAYWTRMTLIVAGKAENENTEALEDILSAVHEQVEQFCEAKK